MKVLPFLLIVFLLITAIDISFATSWTVGVGGDEWVGNVTMDDVSENANGYIELDESIIDSYDTSNYNDYYASGTVTVAYGQAISISSGNHTLTKAAFYLRRQGANTDFSMAVKVWNCSGTPGTDGIPTGSALATSDTVLGTDIPSSFGLVNFTFSTPYQLQDGTDYCIGAEIISQTSGYPWWGYDWSSPTHSGNLFVGKPSTGYNSHSNQDIIFYLYEHFTSGNLSIIVKDAEAISGGSAGDVFKNATIEGVNVTDTWFHGYWNYSTDNSSFAIEDLGNLTAGANVVFSNQTRYGSMVVELNTNNATLTSVLHNVTLYAGAGGAAAPSITSYAPTATIWPEVQDSQLFNVTVDQSTQCRWYINGTLTQTNATPSATHAYTNTSLKCGGCNVTASVNNTNGTDSQTWLFEVGADSIDMVILSEDQNNLSCLISWNTTRIGSNVTHWNVSYNHTTQYYIYHFRYDNVTIIVEQTATTNNETLWFNSSTLLPIGIYYINATAVTVPGISNIQNGSVNTTAQWVSWTVNQSANNIVVYDNGSVNASSTACEGQWSATHACANASDGNWSSYAESAGALTSYAYFNYTVPTAANQVESLWHIKSSADNENLTVPSTCWGGTLYLRARCSDIANSVLWQCDDGPGWTTLHTSVANIVYEQEMLFKYVSTWDNATAAPNITLTGLAANAGYNYSVRSCNATNNSLCSNSSIYSFTTAASMYTISGFILNATSGAGISGATVTGNGSLGGTSSGVDGNYSYSNVVNGVYSISASAAGYASNSTVVTVVGSDMTNQNITLSESGTNTVYACANELIMLNNWSAASQTFAQIDANLTNTSSYSYYNGTKFIDYWSGYPTNSAEIVPKNESCFIMFTADTTVECEPLSGDLTIPDATWFYTFLPGTVHKTVTDIDTSMTADGGDIWSLYRWDNVSQSYNTSGTVQPNEGVVVYSNTTFVWSV